MDFRILGPPQVETRGSGPLEPRQLRVLTVLLLAANHTVARQNLIDAVWDENPPATARRQLQNCVSALRRRIGPAHSIVADGPGYRIRIEPGQLDAQVFHDLVDQARELATHGRTADAAERFRSALRLWRGPALAGGTGRAIGAAAARLDEQRLDATEQCLDLELRLDRHHELVGELTELTAAHPLRERLVGQLMLALHHSGRQAEALRTYQRLRSHLADELGLDPGAALRTLHDTILRGDGPAPASPVGSPARPPRQLPARTPHFVGRADQLKQLTAVLDAAGHERGTVVISAIDGTAGIGKTALAVHWAHQVADRFPDGQLYVNLRGFDPAGSVTSAAEAVRGFLDALGTAPEKVPVSLDAQAALYRSLLADRRLLVVLDNARDAEHMRPLLPGAETCLVVVTSRAWLGGLIADGARPVTLDVLDDDEATLLLARRLGHERVAGQPRAVAELVRRCAGLPLAVAIVAARAAARPNLPLRVLAEQLREAPGRLDALDIGDPVRDVRAVFSWSYRALGPAAARLFRLLGLHPGADATVPAATALAGTDARAPLTELARAHLLDEHLPGRYRCHDLLRAYAAELALDAEPAPQRRAAVHRLLDHYLHTAFAADRQLSPHRELITLDAAVPVGFGGHDEASDWVRRGAHHPARRRRPRRGPGLRRPRLAAAVDAHHVLQPPRTLA